MTVSVIAGDCRDVLDCLPSRMFHTCVTSPPYFGLRDYGHDGQIGLEPTPDEFVAALVEVFREVRRVLRDDATVWLNLGDSYASGGHGGGGSFMAMRGGNGSDQAGAWAHRKDKKGWRSPAPGLKHKDLIGIPWRVAFALQQPWYAGKIANVGDRIWLAAMLDAEGCLFIHKRKAGQDSGAKWTKADGTEVSYLRTQDSYAPGLEVCNTSLAMVERCRDIAGVGSICSQEKGRRQTLYRWTVRSNEAKRVVQEVYPHLVAKQQQARVMFGCPASGERAAAAHAGLMDLHHGKPSDVDFPEPPSLHEPGWFLRQDVIWSKPNPMPESVRDRCTKAHEYLFLLSKRPKYYFDADAVKESATNRPPGNKRAMKGGRHYEDGAEEHRTPSLKEKPQKPSKSGTMLPDGARIRHGLGATTLGEPVETRNRRSVWTVTPQPFKGAHFATFPPALIEPCILAGCPVGGNVLDPFGGAGTTGLVADRLQRRATLIELNPAYASMARNRIAQEAAKRACA